MNLNLKGFAQIVEDMGAALQSSASNLVDISVGSVLRAIFEANASVVLWLQWVLLQVVQASRASTATGPDLDSWMLDFGLTRLPATCATGKATFSRYVANLSANVPPGTLIKTSDGSISFRVAVDQTLSIWNAASSTYVLPAGVPSADLPISCTTGGSVGNVLAGTITVIAAALPGVDSVLNQTPLSNGMDAESDQAFRSRFQTFLASRSRATISAIKNAVSNVRQGLHVLVVENTGSSGTLQIGAFLVIIDDGTGYPSTDLLSSVATAVDAVRPIGTSFAVVAPQVVFVTVLVTVNLSPRANAVQIVSSIQNFVSQYLNNLQIGRPASLTRVAQSAYYAGAGIETLSVLLNGQLADVVTPPGAVIKAGQVTVTTNGG